MSGDLSSPYEACISVLLPTFREGNRLKLAYSAMVDPSHPVVFLLHLSMIPQCLRNPGKGCDGREVR